MRTLYLNNTGHKWRNYSDDYKPETIELKTESGKTIKRVIKYWYAWGNFAYAMIIYKSQKISVTHETILQD